LCCVNLYVVLSLKKTNFAERGFVEICAKCDYRITAFFKSTYEELKIGNRKIRIDFLSCEE